ncbi:MAG: galactose mutarotase [Saprospiraceae bacterium]|nr:galactose mutarotase [Saprospiraceae bacterium]
MKRIDFKCWILSAVVLCSGACQGDKKKNNVPSETSPLVTITKADFGLTPQGPADLYILTNENGMELRITNYGGIIVSWLAPDRSGVLKDIVLGFDDLDGYLTDHPYFGAIVGRYANRINDGKFTLDGKTYQLAQNNNSEHLHGGIKGFDKHLWNATVVEAKIPSLKLSRRSPDMEEGYPGNLDVEVFYTLDPENTLTIDYRAKTDKKTILNLTNHTYFNLNGDGEDDILEHTLRLNSTRYTPVDDNLIPTGDMDSLDGTPFDFRSPTIMGARIEQDDQQLKKGGGYDHNYVLHKHDVDHDHGSDEMMPVALVYAYKTGRTLEIHSTEPGVQFYTGNFLDGSIKGKGGRGYNAHAGFCLETQHFPDSPNQSHFPSVVLSPGEIYRSSTKYIVTAH